jgi:hypothetical protein
MMRAQTGPSQSNRPAESRVCERCPRLYATGPMLVLAMAAAGVLFTFKHIGGAPQRPTRGMPREEHPPPMCLEVNTPLTPPKPRLTGLC